jgi:glyoxylase I family protein
VADFSHVGVCVSDLERSTRFYCELLGFRELFTFDMGPEVEATMAVPGCRFRSRMLARGDVRVELLEWAEPAVQPGDGEPRPMTRTGLTHLCFRVDDVDEVLAAAEAAGGRALRDTLSVLEGAGRDGADVKLVYALDPDGTRVELMSGT